MLLASTERRPRHRLTVCIPVDIASDDSVQEGLRVLREHHGSRIANVIHLAAYFDFLSKPSPKYDQVTVEGTRRLLRGLRGRSVHFLQHHAHARTG